MRSYLLGLDNGGTVTKAGLYDETGTELVIASRNTEMLFPEPGHTERDLTALWNANVETIREVILKSGVEPKEIVGVSVTGHGNGLYLLDAHGNDLGNGIVSTDTRAVSYVEKWSADGTSARAFEKTLSNVWAGQPPALMAWLRDNKPEIMERAGHMLSCKDYVRYRLTGAISSEITDLSGTGFMNIRTGAVDPELFALWGLQDYQQLVTTPVWSTDVAGKITAETAALTGLPEGIPVAGGMFDIVAMAVATGVLQPAQLCVIGGTWSINEFVSTSPVMGADIAMNSLFCVPGHILVNDSTPTSASNLEWFVSQLLGFGTAGEINRKDLYNQCNTMVQETDSTESDVIFLPFLYGSNVHTRGSAAFVGMNGWHETRHLIRAVYEGIVFSHRTHIDRLRARAPEAFTSIRISGGVSRSTEWVQMFADVLQLPVEITAGDELGCLGSAIVAGVAAGVYPDVNHAIGRTVQTRGVVQPKRSQAEVYQRKYERYRAVTEALSAVWDNHELT